MDPPFGAGCVIGDAVEIGTHSRLDANVTTIRHTCHRCRCPAGAVLGSEGFGYVRDSKTGRYEQFPQVGRLVIDNDVEIGANATVDRGALDETTTTLDTPGARRHNVQIGED